MAVGQLAIGAGVLPALFALTRERRQLFQKRDSFFKVGNRLAMSVQPGMGNPTLKPGFLVLGRSFNRLGRVSQPLAAKRLNLLFVSLRLKDP